MFSCGMCNNKKRAYDTDLEPIINPTEYKPKEILTLAKFFICKQK
ncbi:hypothetical protein QW3_2047 [Clostridioides difficile P74]|nr:hypothetical protein QG7_2076 [Clostridioides difficile CD175]EQK31780.1 hypothetical protein QW3_2047 [Clostridioides difficile P74]